MNTYLKQLLLILQLPFVGDVIKCGDAPSWNPDMEPYELQVEKDADDIDSYLEEEEDLDT